uniref:PITH domain-containing protein n=1 Tax=Arcella intermedia TaxID=1963864 RepID=A0A6B2LDZ8_9EUKA
MSKTYQTGVFLKVDFDKCKQVAGLLGIDAIPTFQFYLGDKMIASESGPSKATLEHSVKLFIESDEDKVHEMAEANKQDQIKQQSKEFTEGNLHVMLDHRSKLTNVSPAKYEVEDLFKEGNDKMVKSDCDPEILIQLGFSSMVAIKTIKFTAPDDGSGPKNVKLIINKQNLGFDEARDLKATQQITLKPENLTAEAKPISLSMINFVKVDTLTIFITSNQDDKPQTTLSNIIINGKKL